MKLGFHGEDGSQGDGTDSEVREDSVTDFQEREDGGLGKCGGSGEHKSGQIWSPFFETQLMRPLFLVNLWSPSMNQTRTSV